MKKEHKFTIPNIITSIRIVGAIYLFFADSMSTTFFILYTLCGISDVIDGWVARATKSTSEFGAKLDSIADLLFYAVMAVHIFPALLRDLPIQLWCVAGGVVTARILIYLFVAIKYRRFAAIHTYMNKITGFVIFVMPYFIVYSATVLICSIVAVISSLATLEELLIHLFSKVYPAGVKTIWQIRKNALA